MRYTVGYVPSRRGAEALSLAFTLAAASGAAIDVVVVLSRVVGPTPDRLVPDQAYHSRVENQAEEWLARALADVPAGVDASGRVLRAETVAEGLVGAATGPEPGEASTLLVVGTSRRGSRGHLSVGRIASTLLQSSPVPVGMAPFGYVLHEGITRLTCAMGFREGHEQPLDIATDSAAKRDIPLRVMSLLAVDADAPDQDRRAVILERKQHVERLVARAQERLPAHLEVTGVIGHAESVEGCVAELDFAPDELVLMGSSPLAERGRILLGTSAMRVLQALPVPVVVVPRDWRAPA